MEIGDIVTISKYCRNKGIKYKIIGFSKSGLSAYLEKYMTVYTVYCTCNICSGHSNSTGLSSLQLDIKQTRRYKILDILK